MFWYSGYSRYINTCHLITKSINPFPVSNSKSLIAIQPFKMFCSIVSAWTIDTIFQYPEITSLSKYWKVFNNLIPPVPDRVRIHLSAWWTYWIYLIIRNESDIFIVLEKSRKQTCSPFRACRRLYAVRVRQGLKIFREVAHTRGLSDRFCVFQIRPLLKGRQL